MSLRNLFIAFVLEEQQRHSQDGECSDCCALVSFAHSFNISTLSMKVLHRPLYKSSMRLYITLIPISLSNQRTHDGPASGLPSHNIIVYGLELGKNQCKATPLKIFQDGQSPVNEEPPTPSMRSGIMGRLKKLWETSLRKML